MRDLLEIIRHNEHVDDNGDPLPDAPPETVWEVGYAAGVRCIYRFLKGYEPGFPNPPITLNSEVVIGIEWPKKEKREWLVIEDSRTNGLFMDHTLLNPHGFIPRDVAEKLLGRDLSGTVWFSTEESLLMRNHGEWRNELT